MVTYSSILAWKIPWTEEPGGLQSTGSQRVRHDWSNLSCNLLEAWADVCMLGGWGDLGYPSSRGQLLNACLRWERSIQDQSWSRHAFLKEPGAKSCHPGLPEDSLLTGFKFSHSFLFSFKVFIEFVTILLLFFDSKACGNLGSLARDQTHNSAAGR